MNRKGFTLVELLAVIVIIAIIGGIGFISINYLFGVSEEEFYENLENNIMLAGSEYFLDHRRELPVGNYMSEVSINNLIATIQSYYEDEFCKERII